MPYSNIDKPSKYFNTVLYTGNGSTQTVSGLSFSPDWVWIKARSSAQSHWVVDVIRGADKRLQTNTDSADSTQITGVTSFDTDGFTVGTDGSTNGSGTTFVAWNWDANGAGVSNTSGTISSTVSANTTSGFSIVSYTGTGSNATVGHGLGVAPRMIIFKTRSGLSDWGVYHESITNTKRILLNLTNASGNFTWGGSPTSSVFYVNNDGLVNGSGSTYIAYCFAEVKGYSKFGSYVANGSSDGSFIYTGFTPAFVMSKQTSGSGGNWFIVDNKRNTFNVVNNLLDANLSNAERNANIYDFYSNGFKDRLGLGSGETFIYMAFASSPFTSSKGICATAR